MRLRQLLARLPDLPDVSAVPDLPVARVQEDSRLVRTRDVFVARRGVGVDGRQFIGAAVSTGAAAVVCDMPIETPTGVPVIRVKDAAAAASILANAALGDPSRHMKVIGITGTNGKTTTTFILRHLLRRAGIQCGLIGTCEIDDGHQSLPSAMTTPGAVTLAEILASMRENGCEAVVMETSSHALSQGRVAGVLYAAAGFTNLTGDHLDYHRTMDDYAAAKSGLFMGLEIPALAVVNGCDPWSARMLRRCRARHVRFSTAGPCHDGGRPGYAARELQVRADGSTFVLDAPGAQAEVHMRLVGRHNVQNALCAATIACEAFGLGVQEVAACLCDADGAPGRLERVDAGQPFTVLVDYAHSDDALANVLAALRPITPGKLRLVFGCGGDRDRSKRPRMAQVAEQFADAVYVTSDNPRTEDPDRILREIVEGFQSMRPALVEPDRRAAIRRAIDDAEPRDVVLIAGKGHENYQIIGTSKYPFDDVDEAHAAITAGRAATAERGAPVSARAG